MLLLPVLGVRINCASATGEVTEGQPEGSINLSEEMSAALVLKRLLSDRPFIMGVLSPVAALLATSTRGEDKEAQYSVIDGNSGRARDGVGSQLEPCSAGDSAFPPGRCGAMTCTLA